jgi:hypothetical protein
MGKSPIKMCVQMSAQRARSELRCKWLLRSSAGRFSDLLSSDLSGPSARAGAVRANIAEDDPDRNSCVVLNGVFMKISSHMHFSVYAL